MSMKESYESPKPDNLFAANQVMPVVTGRVVVSEEFPIKRGDIVSKDGYKTGVMEQVYGVAAESGNAGDVIAVYLTGEFNINALSTNITEGISDGDVLAGRIFIKKNITA
ncbi:MAG: hypothetical protein IKA32_11970 [Lentisphaeria bacterium]|nr:hypothetical protein [Lentisphaeria bacterium]